MVASASLSSQPKNVFRIVLDKTSLLPNNRLGGTTEDADDYVTFSEIPETITMRKGASYTDDFILGRSEPYKSYIGSTSTTFTFSARLVAMGERSDKYRAVSTEIAAAGLGLTGRFVGGTAPFIGPAGKLASLAIQGKNPINTGDSFDELVSVTFAEVTKKAAWLEALVYPQYDDGGQAYPPPRVYLTLGQNFTRRGIIKEISIAWKGPWEVSSLLCMVLEASMTFEEVNKVPKGYLQARNREKPASQTKGSEYSGTRQAIDNARSISGL